MPRLTRSKAQAVIHEDSPNSSPNRSPDQQPANIARLPLVELEALNLEDTVKPPAVEDVAVALAALKKPVPKGRKAKGGRKGKKENDKCVLKDIRPVKEVEAVKIACEELMREGSGSDSGSTSSVLEDVTTPRPSKAVQATLEKLSPKKEPGSTPKTDGVSITTHSPAKVIPMATSATSSPKKGKTTTPSEDSFVEYLTSRSPVKFALSPRIEDSVDAIDQLEEALEEVRQAATPRAPIPTVKPSPPESTMKVSKTRGPKPAPKQPVVAKKRMSTATHPTQVRPPPVQPRRPSQPARRVSSTLPTFSLPGEAVAARLRAAREARETARAIAAEEVEAAKKQKRKPSTVSAKPIPTGGSLRLSKAPRLAVRPTKTSTARTSSLSMTPSAVLTSGKAPTAVSKRLSSLAMPKRQQTPHQPATAAPKPSTIAARPARVPSKPPLSGTGSLRIRPKASAPGSLSIPRERRSVSLVDEVAAKKAREEVAKKARAEAADRGREASRAWAEKMGRKAGKVGTVKSL
ncbi:MAG: hypothetical protein M1814_000330 [Vezdaea aestivalis]|nr:MAG: hypothetical protein M1814_000330 [Vezdaea aestivalis]